MAFPSFPATGGFTPDDLEGFAEARFGNFKSALMGPGFTLYAGGPDDDEPETADYIKLNFSGQQYLDLNNNGRYDEMSDTKVTDFRVFISHDGAYLLKQYEDIRGHIRDDETAVFLEIPDGDVFSDTVLLVAAGKNAEQYVSALLHSSLLSGHYTLTEQQITRLVDSLSKKESLLMSVMNTVVEAQHYVIDQITDIGIEVFEAIANFFGDTIRIPDSFWNSGIEGYTVGKLNQMPAMFTNLAGQLDKVIESWQKYLPPTLVRNLREMAAFIKTIAEVISAVLNGIAEFVIAFVCGIWNALMDLIAGIFGLIKLIFQAIQSGSDQAYSVYKLATNPDYYKSLALEYMDNAFQAILKIDWKVVILKAAVGMLEIMEFVIQLPEKLFTKITEINHTEVGYYVGYIVFQILEFLFPPLEFAKLGNLGKLGKIADIFEEVGLGIQKATRAAGKAVRTVAEEFFALVEAFIEKLKKGTQSFAEWVEEIFAKIRKWLDELLTGASKASDEVTELFRRGKPTTALGEVRFRRAELANFSRKLEQKYAHLDLKVNIVTPNTPANRARLKIWDKRETLGSFNSGPPPVIHVRQRCTHLTMQHEIWHLEDFERLGPIEFNKMPNWQHEESVWFKILHSKELWTEQELASSFGYYYRTAIFETGQATTTKELIALAKKHNCL